MISNLGVYLSIAEDALEESERLEKAARSPKPDGEPGFVVKYDPEKKGFKSSLITIAFAGIYLEALLYIVGVSRIGKMEYLKIDKMHYEEKLKKLGLTDSELLDTCKRFRKARNDLVHEKALESAEMIEGEYFFAQREARNAVAFVKHVAALLQHIP